MDKFVLFSSSLQDHIVNQQNSLNVFENQPKSIIEFIRITEERSCITRTCHHPLKTGSRQKSTDPKGHLLLTKKELKALFNFLDTKENLQNTFQRP